MQQVLNILLIDVIVHHHLVIIIIMVVPGVEMKFEVSLKVLGRCSTHITVT